MFQNIGPSGFLILALVILVLFGRGKIAGMMGEVGKGITSFRRGMDEGRREVEDQPGATTTTVVRDVTPGAATVAPGPTVVTTAPGAAVTTVAEDRRA